MKPGPAENLSRLASLTSIRYTLRMKKKKRHPIRLPAPECSDSLQVTVPPQSVGMFRFLLEGYDNLAGFTVLDRTEARLKVFFSPHQHAEARSALRDIAATLPMTVEDSAETDMHGQDVTTAD